MLRRRGSIKHGVASSACLTSGLEIDGGLLASVSSRDAMKTPGAASACIWPLLRTADC